MIFNLLFPDLKRIIAKGRMSDQNDFFAALYRKQASWSGHFPETNRKPYTTSYKGKFAVDKGISGMKVYSFSITPKSWVEFQAFVDYAYGFALFTPIWAANVDAITYQIYLDRAGIFTRDTSPGYPTSNLTASDGVVLAVGLVTPLDWETAWNALRVPYERVTVKNKDFEYIKNLAVVGENPLLFRKSPYPFP